VERQRVSFFLLFEGRPVQLEEDLRAAGISDGDHLELGVLTYAIE
jgi:hypothetical protein